MTFDSKQFEKARMKPMSNIQYYDYPEKILFKQVYEDLDKQIAKEGHGHLNEIRWLKGTDFRPSREDAVAFLKCYTNVVTGVANKI